MYIYISIKQICWQVMTFLLFLLLNIVKYQFQLRLVKQSPAINFSDRQLISKYCLKANFLVKFVSPYRILLILDFERQKIFFQAPGSKTEV
jgi:hypothetical protein